MATHWNWRVGTISVLDEYGTADVYERVEPATPTLEELRSLTGEYVSDARHPTHTCDARVAA